MVLAPGPVRSTSTSLAAARTSCSVARTLTIVPAWPATEIADGYGRAAPLPGFAGDAIGAVSLLAPARAAF